MYLVVAALIGGVVFVIAMLFFGRGEQLPALAARTSPAQLPARDVKGEDVQAIRFSLALRGYRMSDVDWTLERLAVELERSRQRIYELENGGGTDDYRTFADRADLPLGPTTDPIGVPPITAEDLSYAPPNATARDEVVSLRKDATSQDLSFSETGTAQTHGSAEPQDAVQPQDAVRPQDAVQPQEAANPQDSPDSESGARTS